MLLRRSTIVLVLFVLLVAVAAASANAVKPTPVAETDDLIIVSGYDVKPTFSAKAPSGVSMLATSAYTISQCQTNWHGKYISQGCPYYIADLNWGNSVNSLQLRIYRPDARVYGPYYDSSDGRIDGRIYLYISQSGGLTGGTYYHEVYGYKVSGTEDYTF